MIGNGARGAAALPSALQPDPAPGQVWRGTVAGRGGRLPRRRVVHVDGAGRVAWEDPDAAGVRGVVGGKAWLDWLRSNRARLVAAAAA